MSRWNTPPHCFTAREIRFLEKKVAGRSYAELTELFNRHFGLSLTICQINRACLIRGLSNGRDGRFPPGQVPFNKGKKGIHLSPETEWKKGNRPWNWKPVGTERISLDGYVEVRIRNPSGKPHKNWKAKHLLIWERAHGRIPRGHVVIFADGNKRNFDLDNLILVYRSELAVMNHLKLISPQGDLTRIGKSIADIKLLIGKRQRKAKKGGEKKIKKADNQGSKE